VLDRYVKAARSVDADVIMRVTSDCPLIDPELCADVLRARAEARADYAANNFVYGYPHGLDCEIFTRAALEEAGTTAQEPYDREHVSPWMRRNPQYRRESLVGPGTAAAKWRWTLDFPEDLDFLRALHHYLPPPPAMPGFREIAAVVERVPELTEINANRAQR
jgi:spore coat polysaccharide biosynthesis protein SpsF